MYGDAWPVGVVCVDSGIGTSGLPPGSVRALQQAPEDDALLPAVIPRGGSNDVSALDRNSP